MRLFISFSGGETSAFMARWLLLNARHKYDDIRVVFANTGQEHEATLEFVRQCDEHFALGVVWVESVTHHGSRRGSSHRVVNFETASRNGEPFEESIKKYGIPNSPSPHCTRELKFNPLKSYLSSVGWAPGSYDTAIGIRADEINRISTRFEERRIVYPLITDVPTTKPMINQFWERQPFRLRLKGYQGNCKWCWKKTLRKHLTIMRESPEAYDFPERMEREYGLVGPEFSKKDVPGYRRVFMRDNLSVLALRELAKTAECTPAEDESQVYPERDLFGHELDLSSGCSESCDIFHDGKAADTWTDATDAAATL